MTPQDIATIESALSLSVPDQYRSLMQVYPFSGSFPADAYVPDNAAYVCDLNGQIRSDGIYGNRWGSGLFAIGTTMGGDAHVLDTSLDNPPVLRFSQASEDVLELAASLEYWFAQLEQWYVAFDPDAVTDSYTEITTAIDKAGFRATPPEPMDGWHRICVATQLGPDATPPAKSFWIACLDEAWYAGMWNGVVYHVPAAPGEFSVAWLNQIHHERRSEYVARVKQQFKLRLMDFDDFDAICRKQAAL